MKSTNRLCPSAVLLTVAAMACGGGSSDPRASGRSQFEALRPAGGGGEGLGIPTGYPPELPSVLNERPAVVPPGDTAVLVGSKLYVLNGYRGLQVIETASEPRLVGGLSMPGLPYGLFVVGTTAYALVGSSATMVPCPTCPGGAQPGHETFVAAIDVTAPDEPRLRGKLPLDGEVIAARLDGGVMHLVLRHGDGWTPVPTDRPGASVLAVDLADPAAPRVRGRLELPGPQWVDEVQFARGVVYLSAYGRQYWTSTGCTPAIAGAVPAGAEGCTRLVAIDLATLEVSASRELRGRLYPGAASHHDGVLRAVLVSSGTPMPGSPRLITLAAATAAELNPVGSVELPHDGNEPRVRFAGKHAYVLGANTENPLTVVDLTDPMQPTLGAPIPTVGLIDQIAAARDGRLVTLGYERAAPPCAQRELAILDVTIPAAPRVVARQTLTGRHHVVSSRGRFVTGLSEQGDLLALPFWAPRNPNQPHEVAAPVGLQLVDVDLARAVLTPRGHTLVGGAMDVVFRADDRVMALSSERLDVVDAGDRSAPTLAGQVELSRWVADVKVVGDSAIELVMDPLRGGFQLYLVPASDPNAARPTAAVAFDGHAGPLYTHGELAYLFWTARAADGRSDPRLDIFQVRAGTLERRSSHSLAGPAPVNLGGEATSGDVQDAVRQIGGTTFLVPLFRVRDCSPPAVPGWMTPGSAGVRCQEGPVLTPPPPPPPPPPAAPLPDTSGQRLGGDCPGSEADFMVIDASDAAAPRLASRFRDHGDGERLGSLVRDETVFLMQVEATENTPRPQLRHFVTEVRLADPARPAVGPRVNVPGTLVAVRPETASWFTVEPILDDAGRIDGQVLSALYRPAGASKAHLERQVRLKGGVSGPVADRQTLFFTVEGQLVAVDLGGADAPSVVSRTPIPGATTSGERWRSGGLLTPPAATAEPNAPLPVRADVHAVVHERVFVLVDSRVMLILDARDRARPQALDRLVLSPRGASPVRAAPGERAFVPRAEWGVDVIDLAPR